MIMQSSAIFHLFNLSIIYMTSMPETSPNEPSIAELTNKLDIHKKQLNVFYTLTAHHKLMKDHHENVLFSVPPGYFQSWTRWWHGENKKTTLVHLDEFFTEFIKLLDKELGTIKREPSREIVTLGKNTTKFINDIIPGIHSLKTTYPECLQLHAKIDSIILILLDFNNDFRKESKCCCARQRSKSFDIQ